MKRSSPIFSCTRPADWGNTNGSKINSQNVSDSSIPLATCNSDKLKTPGSRTGTLRRSCSIPSLIRVNDDKDSGIKFSLVKTTSSGERTPVSYFCTPRRSSGNRFQDNQSNLKPHVLSSGKSQSCQLRTPLKRFVSDVNLHKPSDTPNCFSIVNLDTPKLKGDADLPVHPDEETNNLTVAVRVRPLSQKETGDPSIDNVIHVQGNEVVVTCETGITHSFSYDHCFWSCDPNAVNFAGQDVVFSTLVSPLIDKVFEGYNACLFAYGQTGSGKSYSMMGLDDDAEISIGNEIGIIPRFCYELFERIASLEYSDIDMLKASTRATIDISYFEIYNEKIHDLLGESCEGGKRAPLKVREHPSFGPYVADLSVHAVSSFEELQGWILRGNSQRAIAATGMNENSSRSHSIFSIILNQTQEDNIEGEVYKHTRKSKINLVDLAGSERLSQTCASGERLREGVSINLSLLTLGKVIAALADGGLRRKGFVPYRESVLTWLLRESLGGNSHTTMLATISPANIHLDETLATLRYACQARTIVNRVRVNEHPHDRLIKELKGEVERLHALVEDYERQLRMGVPRRLVQQNQDELSDKMQEIESLKEQLANSEKVRRDSDCTRRLELQNLKEDKSELERQVQFLKSIHETELQELSKKLKELEADKLEMGIQRNLLETELKHLKSTRKTQQNSTSEFNVAPYRSNFLKDFEAALNETVHLESSLESNTSTSTNFSNLQAEDQGEIENCKEDDITLNGNLKDLSFIDDNSSEDEKCDISNEETQYNYNNSNESQQQESLISSYNDSALETTQDSSSAHDFTNASDSNCDNGVRNCLQEIEIATNKLSNLCKNRQLFEKVESLIQELKSTLNACEEMPPKQSDSFNIKLLGIKSPTKYFSNQPSDAVPVKSNLRSPGVSRTPKAVRFFQINSEQMFSPE